MKINIKFFENINKKDFLIITIVFIMIILFVDFFIGFGCRLSSNENEVCSYFLPLWRRPLNDVPIGNSQLGWGDSILLFFFLLYLYANIFNKNQRKVWIRRDKFIACFISVIFLIVSLNIVRSETLNKLFSGNSPFKSQAWKVDCNSRTIETPIYSNLTSDNRNKSIRVCTYRGKAGRVLDIFGRPFTK